MHAFRNPTSTLPRRAALAMLLAAAFALRTFAADAEPVDPNAPTAPSAPAAPIVPDQPAAPVVPPAETPPVEAVAPIPAPAAPADNTPALRRVYREQLIGIFQNVHLRAHETADQVVGVFGDVLTEGRVDDQVVAIFGNADVREKVGGQVVSVFGNCTITQDVDGDVVCVFGELVIGPGVHVRGQIVSVGGVVERDPSVIVDGQEVSVPIPGLRHFGSWVRECLLTGRLYRHDRASTWVFVAVMLVASLLVAGLFRKQVDASTSVLERRPTAAIVNGMLSALVVPTGLLLITATGVGALIVPFLWIAVMFGTMFGAIAIARFCGTRLGLGANPALALAGGHVILAAIYALPVIGLLTWAGVMMLGFGAAITALFESRRERREARANGGGAATPPPAATPPVSTPAPTSPATPAPEATVAPLAPPIAPADTSFASAGAAGFTAENISPPTPAPAPAPVTVASMPASAGAIPPPLAPSPVAAIERAGFFLRVAAGALDVVFVSIVHAFMPFGVSFPFLAFAYFVAFWAWRATTPGGVIMNIRIDRLDGRKVDAGIAVVRGLGAVISCAPLFLGFIWMNWDPERQTWHDKIAGTVVVRVPRGQALI